MDLTNSTVKTPEPEPDSTPKLSPFTNGVLKRHAPLQTHRPNVVKYKECLKNHAATLGGHAVDGCGEFMPSATSSPGNSTSLKCAACGCHRNFHRREPEEVPQLIPALEFQPHHHNYNHHPPPPPPCGNGGSSPSDSPSPPPISSSYYPSAPHMLIALSHGPIPDNNNTPAISTPLSTSCSNRKRFRTRFTQDQKEKMLEFSHKLGWKMQKRDEGVILEFCREIGVEKGVFKVWMHNNKSGSTNTNSNSAGKKDINHSTFSNDASPPLPEPNPNGYCNIGSAAAHHQESTLNLKQDIGNEIVMNHSHCS